MSLSYTRCRDAASISVFALKIYCHYFLRIMQKIKNKEKLNNNVSSLKGFYWLRVVLVLSATLSPACGTWSSALEQTSRPPCSKLGHEAKGSVPSFLPRPPNWCQVVGFLANCCRHKAAFREEINKLLDLYF